jgi:hypothetical protein
MRKLLANGQSDESNCNCRIGKKCFFGISDKC